MLPDLDVYGPSGTIEPATMERLMPHRLNRWAVIATTAIIGGLIILAAAAALAAERDAAYSRDHGPGWRIHSCAGPDCRWHGRVLTSPTACSLDLASLANVMPKGTHLACARVDSNHRISDR